jgi:dolichol-phosphate mannosyltransferase
MTDIILLPTYNEKENVKLIIPEIFNLFPDIRVLVIDDNSPDGTAQAVNELMNRYPNLKILARAKKTGLGDAYKAGIEQVIKDNDIRAIITMDADGSHAPKYLPVFTDRIANCDLVIGSRYVAGGGVENWEKWRQQLSRCGNFYANLLTGLPINDFTAGFMCIRREMLANLDLSRISAAGYSFLIELKFYLIHGLKARVEETPIIFYSRRGGESKLSWRIVREGMKTPWRLFYRRLLSK